MSDKAEQTTKPKVFPVQTRQPIHDGAKVNELVYMAAYEVYCEVFGSQQTLIEGSCRGGFGAGELMAYLYARAFSRKEWRKRVHEALDRMEQL